MQFENSSQARFSSTHSRMNRTIDIRTPLKKCTVHIKRNTMKKNEIRLKILFQAISVIPDLLWVVPLTSHNLPVGNLTHNTDLIYLSKEK